MLRKLSLVAVAAASLGAPLWRRRRPRPGAAAGTMAAGIITHGWGGPRVFIGGPAYYGGGYGGCYARRLVPTPWGPRWRLVNRCY